MAPISQLSQAELANLPLADYFFIAGIESSKIAEERPQTNGLAPPTVEATIEENEALDTSKTSRPTSSGTLTNQRMSWEPRKSVGSIIGPISENKTASNRSSTTIKGVQVGGSGLSDADFDAALRKFASDRESFTEELQFSAGAVAQNNRPKHPRPRTQRIINEEAGAGGLKSGVGSLRKRLSTMSSMKRQPSMVSRQASTRTSKRLSGYNSVIPTPQPFLPEPNMHPLKRRYEPVLLDVYPPKTDVAERKKRNPFPDYVPMFTFPNDINVVSSDERPKSTWHGFSMTSGDNSKLHSICLIMWLPLNATASASLELQCEEWRKANMSGEERELASSLGERLAIERAKLSRLLAKLPAIPSESDERERLEDDISACEEKISLMTDMLRPVRHGAASKIEGLTDGETGLWIPRAYGVLGRDGGHTSFWKEWLKAVAVPMTNGSILRVPPSSPRAGMWQPLERYVVNLCAEALSPISSMTQVELAVRELRLYARKEAVNELPGSRNVDLYALFRCLSIPNIVTLFEHVLAEGRIILVSSHTSMLHLASAAIVNLLYPLQWANVFIPVLPARLIQALEAPCPYIVGIEKRYENVEFPEDDFLLVDLDSDSLEAPQGHSAPALPRQQRRKLTSLLHLAAPHHNRYGVPFGPPAYAIETFPFDSFSSENPQIFTSKTPRPTLATFVSLNSASFGSMSGVRAQKNSLFNAFSQARNDSSRGADRPSTASTSRTATSPPSPRTSPVSTSFPPVPTTPISRSDSGYALQASLREKRSGHFDTASRRSSSFGVDRVNTLRRPSQPFLGHSSTSSTSTLGHGTRAPSSYAPSVYAQSTLAASTIMPGMLMQPVRNTDTIRWAEGHCLHYRPQDERTQCSICDERADDGIYKCNSCSCAVHARCLPQVCLPCPMAFHEDQVRAAFVRCFASLFYTYRRFLHFATGDRKRSGMVYSFNMEGFMKSLPHENMEYMQVLQQTQSFNEFVHEREMKRADDPSIKLFDQIILSKKNRGRTSIFSKSSTEFLTDVSDHLWRTASAVQPNSRSPGDYRQIISRIPAKLDPALMKEPRVIQGAPRIPQGRAKRKPIPSMLGPNSSSK